MQKQEFKDCSLQEQSYGSNPRKVSRTDNSSSNLIANLLRNLIEASKNNSKQLNSIQHSKPKPSSLSAPAILQPINLLPNSELSSNQSPSHPSSDSNSSTGKMQFRDECCTIKESWSLSKRASLNPVQSEPPLKAVSFKKVQSAPQASTEADDLSHSQKMFMNSCFSQSRTPTQTTMLTKSLINDENSSYVLNSILQNLPREEVQTLKTNQVTESKTKCKKCNCKNSKCLKLYCECMAGGEYCGSDCRCQNCYNNPVFKTSRSQAVSQILEKNPHTMTKSNTDNQLNKDTSTTQKLLRSRGCTCKKSGCNKKYCECFAAGVPCGEFCRCENCKNCNGIRPHQSAETSEGSFHCKSEDECYTTLSSQEITTVQINSFDQQELHLSDSALSTDRNEAFEPRGDAYKRSIRGIKQFGCQLEQDRSDTSEGLELGQKTLLNQDIYIVKQAAVPSLDDN